MNVVAFAPTPDTGVVRCLEELLDIAKQGRLVSLVACGELIGGDTTSTWGVTARASWQVLAGCAARLQHRIVQAWEQSNER